MAFHQRRLAFALYARDSVGQINSLKRERMHGMTACMVASYALAVDVHGKAYVSNFSDSVRKPPHAFVQTAPSMR